MPNTKLTLEEIAAAAFKRALIEYANGMHRLPSERDK